MLRTGLTQEVPVAIITMVVIVVLIVPARGITWKLIPEYKVVSTI